MLKINKKTPHGGEYSEVYYYDENGKEKMKSKGASVGIAYEYDKDGKVIAQTIFKLDKDGEIIGDSMKIAHKGKDGKIEVY